MIKRHTGINCCILFIISLTLFACTPWERKPFYEADISSIPAQNIEIYRYEELLFTANPFILKDEIEPHIKRFEFFLGDEIYNPEALLQLYNYVTDPYLIDLYHDSRELWADTDKLASDLSRAFRFYEYHFPESDIPAIYTYISGLDYTMPIMYAEGHLIIAVDTYLGSDYPAYEQIGIPRYMSQWMIPERTIVDIFHSMADRYFRRLTHAPETLLDHMIYEGKRLYFLDCMLPALPDSLKIAYSTNQDNWMKRNAGFVWSYKLENDLLFSTDHSVIQKFIREAPFTATFSRQSAPRTGIWLGWQIVRDYMKRNPETSLEELIMLTDSHRILTGARFRP